MTPTEAITALEKALEEVRKWHKMKAPTVDGRLDLLRAQRDSLRDFSDACSPLAIRTLLDAHAGALRANAELLDQMHHFANADQRLWDEGQRDSESFIRWVRSRAAHLLAKFTDRAALATNTKAQP